LLHLCLKQQQLLLHPCRMATAARQQQQKHSNCICCY
jgi:hypothetical protein